MRSNTLGMTGKGHKVAGVKNGMHRLKPWMVKYARRVNEVYGVSTYQLAEVYDVAESTIRRAVQRKTWRRVR